MSLIETAKEIAKLAQKADNVELYQKIIQLQTETMEMQEENRELRARAEDAEEALRFQGDLEFRDNVYWKRTDSGEEEGPYCSPCWDGKRKAVRLHTNRRTEWKCPDCGNGTKEGGGGIGTVTLRRS